MKRKNITPISTGATKDGEKNDCVVRAIVNVTGYDYDHVNNLAKKHGRKDRQGMQGHEAPKLMKDCGLKYIGAFGRTNDANALDYYASKEYEVAKTRNDSMTLGKLMKALPFGKFIVIIKGHAVAMVDGKLIDNSMNSSTARVCCLYQFGEMV